MLIKDIKDRSSFGISNDENNADPKHFLIRMISIISIISIIIVISGLALLFFGRETWEDGLYGKDSWHIVYLSDNQIFVGQIRSVTEEAIYLSEPNYLEVTKRPISETTSSSSELSLQLIRDWHTITPVFELNPKLLTKEGFLPISRSEVLFWAKIYKESQIIPVIKKVINKQ